MSLIQQEFIKLLEEKVDFFGFVDVQEYTKIAVGEKNWIKPQSLIPNAKTIIVIGLRTIDDILRKPSKNVAWHNITINIRLNDIIYELSRVLMKEDFEVYPHFTINQSYNPPDWKIIAHDIMPYKILGKMAGMGSIGKNNLFIHKKFRTGVRLTALTTSAIFPYTQDKAENLCNSCGICIANCPAKAITNEGYDPEKCWSFLSKTQRKWGYSGCNNCMWSCLKKNEM